MLKLQERLRKHVVPEVNEARLFDGLCHFQPSAYPSCSAVSLGESTGKQSTGKEEEEEGGYDRRSRARATPGRRG